MRLIDTNAVIKAVDKHTFETKDGLCLDDDISVILEDVPTIEERKTGRWIDVACPNCGCKIHIEPEHKPAHWIVYEVANTEEEQPIAWQCPNCDEVVDCKYNFCPECGQEFEVNT